MSGIPNQFDLRQAELGPLGTNSYAFRAPGGWVLVDAPEGALAWLEGEGIEPALLLLSHQHFDHVLGTGEVVTRFGCPVWSFAQRSADLTLEAMFSGLEGTSFEIAEYPIERLIEETADGETLDVLGAAVEVLHVPGHSPDSICFLLRKASILFGGDVLFAGGLGRTDFPGGDHDTLISAIKTKLLPLDDGCVVYPGHGPSHDDQRREGWESVSEIAGASGATSSAR